MTQHECPACRATIAVADINIEQGVALCRACGRLSRLTDIVAQSEVADPSLAADPPPGCRWYQDGMATVLVATTRSVGGASFILLFSLFWNGIVSIFVLIAAAGLYTNLVGPLPSWFPAPANGQGSSGGGGALMSLGETLFLCIFLTPFILVGVGSFLAVLHCLFGRLEVRLLGDEGQVRNAVGPLSWKRKFNAAEVTRISEGQTPYTQNGRTRPLIVIEADRTIRFGSGLTSRRRNWMMAALHALLLAGPAVGGAGRAAALGRR